MADGFTAHVLEEVQLESYSTTYTGGGDPLPASVLSFTEVMQSFSADEDLSMPVASLVAEDDPVLSLEDIVAGPGDEAKDEPVSNLLSTLSFPTPDEGGKSDTVSDLLETKTKIQPRADPQDPGVYEDEERGDAPGDIDLSTIETTPFQDFGSHTFVEDDTALGDELVQAVI